MKTASPCQTLGHPGMLARGPSGATPGHDPATARGEERQNPPRAVASPAPFASPGRRWGTLAVLQPRGSAGQSPLRPPAPPHPAPQSLDRDRRLMSSGESQR